ncbi:MAG: hypothetical protein OXG56_11010 [Gammaproteobacteria bacterium]|nr:hypothetical protein [Gammaproteobacteria bacterium]
MCDRDQAEALRVYRSIEEYCKAYNIPKNNLLDILEDQKVLPMIRGKATEYIGAAVLRKTLDPRDWTVEKLNLNPQPGGTYDEDVSITYRMTGKRLKAETKNAVRGSFRLGTRLNKSPHFKVKCHRSRSHLTKATNDRYMASDFDVLLCNVSNSIFRQRSLDRGLPLLEASDSIKWLKAFYGVESDGDLRRKSYDDWRICLPENIVQQDGTIPRTPTVLIEDDPYWFDLSSLASRIRTLINGK